MSSSWLLHQGCQDTQRRPTQRRRPTWICSCQNYKWASKIHAFMQIYARVVYIMLLHTTYTTVYYEILHYTMTDCTTLLHSHRHHLALVIVSVIFLASLSAAAGRKPLRIMSHLFRSIIHPTSCNHNSIKVRIMMKNNKHVTMTFL